MGTEFNPRAFFMSARAGDKSMFMGWLNQWDRYPALTKEEDFNVLVNGLALAARKGHASITTGVFEEGGLKGEQVVRALTTPGINNDVEPSLSAHGSTLLGGIMAHGNAHVLRNILEKLTVDQIVQVLDTAHQPLFAAVRNGQSDVIDMALEELDSSQIAQILGRDKNGFMDALWKTRGQALLPVFKTVFKKVGSDQIMPLLDTQSTGKAFLTDIVGGKGARLADIWNVLDIVQYLKDRQVPDDDLARLLLQKDDKGNNVFDYLKSPNRKWMLWSQLPNAGVKERVLQGLPKGTKFQPPVTTAGKLLEQFGSASSGSATAAEGTPTTSPKGAALER